MMKQKELTIKNVKLSCKIQLHLNENISFNTDNIKNIKYYTNFCVIKSKYTYIIFTKKGKGINFHVNITKIPNESHIEKSITELKNIINTKHDIKNIFVENLTCTDQLPQNINLRLLLNHFIFSSNVDTYRVRYRPEKFPGMFISLKNLCTIVLFSNGKIVIIGASNKEDAKSGIFKIQRLLQDMQSHKSN